MSEDANPGGRSPAPSSLTLDTHGILKTVQPENVNAKMPLSWKRGSKTAWEPPFSLHTALRREGVPVRRRVTPLLRALLLPWIPVFGRRLLPLALLLGAMCEASPGTATPGEPASQADLPIPGTTAAPPQRTPVEQRIAAAATHAAQGDDYSAEKVAREILAQPDVRGEFRVQAWLWVAKAQSLYGNAEAWAKVRAACEEVLKHRGLLSQFQIEALRMSVPAYLALRAYPEAEMAQRLLMAHPEVSAWERNTHRLALARTLLLQRAFEETRELLRWSVLPAASGHVPPFWERALEEWGADRQLLWALTFYEETPSARARLELLDVLSMAGHRGTHASTREARLRLHQQRWLPSRERVTTVLFVGSSHTIRGNVPLLVEQLAASAPPGRLRVVAGEQTRMGTGMRGHWNDGEAPDTARGKMAAGLWDQVVVETFYRNSREDLWLYGSRYAEAANRSGAQLVLYETPVARAVEYPGAYQAFRESNLWLARGLGVRLGPSVGAWMRVLGPQPSEERLGILYADWIHATARGAYLTACCLYPALTGESPVGLFVPEGLLSPEEALRYQQAAWDSYQEADAQLWAERLQRKR